MVLSNTFTTTWHTNISSMWRTEGPYSVLLWHGRVKYSGMEYCVQNQSMQQGAAAAVLFYIHIFFNKNNTEKASFCQTNITKMNKAVI
jgi:hypothetical protein